MRNLGFIAVFLGFFLCAGSASATTYYVDYASGADTNNGTAKSTPWKRAPGMVGCANTCSSTTIVAGDHIVLKGGVVWPNAVMTWAFGKSGSAGNYIVIGGTDQTWYDATACSAKGYPGWCRPVLDAGGLTAGTNNWMVSAPQYTDWESIEFARFANNAADGAYGHNGMFYIGGTPNVTMNDLYFHNWIHAAGQDGGWAIMADSHYPSGNAGSILSNSVFDNSDSADAGYMNCGPGNNQQCSTGSGIWGSIPDVHNSVFRWLSNGIIGQTELYYNNLVEYFYFSPDTGTHSNGFETNGSTSLIYNNLFRHYPNYSGFPLATNPCCDSSRPNGITYVFNNVFYDMSNSNNIFVTSHSGTQSTTTNYQKVFNNTLECGPDSGSPGNTCGNCDNYYAGCDWQNNHWITSLATPIVQNGAPSNCLWNQSGCGNIVQTKAQANAQGYNSGQTYGFSPTSSGNATVNAGANLTSACSATFTYTNGTVNLAPLCSDTGYACTYSSVTHTVSCPARKTNTRPAAPTLWDVGAYYISSMASAPAAPIGLTALVQ
ncbi:MAG: hypothetical protein LAN61_03165 [Acidobacteriia bacterium]|nr:hypothetical protein [Terriglobia bacterium]